MNKVYRTIILALIIVLFVGIMNAGIIADHDAKNLSELAVSISNEDGEKAAQLVNASIHKKEDFKIALKEVLDSYYSGKKVNDKELQVFQNHIDVSAGKIIQHYEEAADERNNAKNLDYQTEKVLVSFPNGTPMEEIDEVVKNEAEKYEVIDSGKTTIPENLPDYKKKRLEKIKDYKTNMVILADIRLEDTVKRAIERFERYDCVISAEENTYFHADGEVSSSSGSVKTNDPDFNNAKQWHMNRINVPEAWNAIEKSGHSYRVWVAVIDCGVQMNHPDLKGNLLTNYSVDVTQGNKRLVDCEDKVDGTGQYTSGHGTMVAGVIAAKGNNGMMGAGVASCGSNFAANNHRIMAIKTDNSVNADRHITLAYLHKAINYAVNHGAEIINISYSAPRKSYTDTEFKNVQNAIERAIDANVVVVGSAGNDASTSLRYPAAFEGVIGVGASDYNNEPTSYTNESDAVDILAPSGELYSKNIYSTSPTTMNASGYRTSRGTSYAAPQVSAAIAMMYSLNYFDLTPATVLTKLKDASTVDVNGWLASDKIFKLLDAGKAVANESK